jgi:hypothetical protein
MTTLESNEVVNVLPTPDAFKGYLQSEIAKAHREGDGHYREVDFRRRCTSGST